MSRLERVVCVAGGWARVRLMGRCVAGKLGGLGRKVGRPWQGVVAVLAGLGKVLATLVWKSHGLGSSGWDPGTWKDGVRASLS